MVCRCPSICIVPRMLAPFRADLAMVLWLPVVAGNAYVTVFPQFSVSTVAADYAIVLAFPVPAVFADCTIFANLEVFAGQLDRMAMCLHVIVCVLHFVFPDTRKIAI